MEQFSNIAYSIPYVILLLFYAVLALLWDTSMDKLRTNITIYCVMAYMLFFGLRGFVFDDWVNYYPAFEKCSLDSIVNIMHTVDDNFFEPGFMILMILCKFICPYFQFFVFVCCAINCVLLLNFFRKYVDNIPLAFVFFICMGGIVIQTNLMRNSLALLVFVNALVLIEKRRFLPYLFVCLICVSFHLSSLLFVPLYFFYNKHISKWIYLALIIVGNITFLLDLNFMTNILISFAGRFGEEYELLVERYTEGVLAEKSVTLSIGYMERLFTSFLIFCYYDKLVEIRKANVMFINAFICYFLMFFLFSEFAELSERLSMLFIFCYWILWGDIVKCFSIDNNKKLYIVYLSVYCLLKVVGSTKLITQKYDNILFNSESYEERLYIHDKYTEDKF